MPDIRNPLVWLAGILALGLIVFVLRSRFNAEARARRRLERSHRPVVSRKQGPTVKLAVKVGKSRTERR